MTKTQHGKGHGPMHWQTTTGTDTHEFCKTVENSAWRVRLTQDRIRVTCTVCLRKLEKQDQGIPIRPHTHKHIRQAQKAKRLWNQLRATGAIQ